ncbi:MAG: hypothetical protein ACFFA7_06545 [Promethearchaeota archaeon]
MSDRLKDQNNHFEKLLKLCLIFGIIVVSGFVIYFILTPEPGFIAYSILNENQEAGNYPTKAVANETISFYLNVENHLNREFMFGFKIKKGNEDTLLSSNNPSNGTLYQTIGNFSLNPNEFHIYGEYNISFSEVGEDQIIIAELWQIKHEIESFFIVHYLHLNITN